LAYQHWRIQGGWHAWCTMQAMALFHARILVVVLGMRNERMRRTHSHASGLAAS